jgi:hypothetical protein
VVSVADCYPKDAVFDSRVMLGIFPLRLRTQTILGKEANLSRNPEREGPNSTRLLHQYFLFCLNACISLNLLDFLLNKYLSFDRVCLYLLYAVLVCFWIAFALLTFFSWSTISHSSSGHSFSHVFVCSLSHLSLLSSKPSDYCYDAPGNSATSS